MRLFAYGGTSYNVRHQIGEWPTVPRGALEDTYGLPDQALTFGVGILADRQPFLILRQRQTTESGRNYAFTLLFDPGRALWEQFGWNAAGLTLALFAAPNAIGATLLTRPEAFTDEETLRRSLDELHPPSPPLRINDTVRAHRLSGATPEMTDELLRCAVSASLSDQFIIVDRARFGFTARPTPEEMAARLDLLPPTFRLGSGWLIGGSLANGQAFGSRFIIGDEAVNDAPNAVADNVKRRIAEGERILVALQVVSASQFSETAERIALLPLWEWDQSGRSTPREYIENFILLAEALRPSRSIETLLPSIERKLEQSPPLASEIRRAAYLSALEGVEKLSRLRTLFILHHHLDHKMPLDPSAVARLDPATLIETLVERKIPPGAATCSLPLAPATRCEIWSRMIGAAQDYSTVPSLLRSAADDLIQERETGANDPLLAKLIDAAHRRTLIAEDSLQIWNSFPRDHLLWTKLGGMLRDEARRRTRHKIRHWKNDYLIYAQDPGGYELAANKLDAEELSLLIKLYLNEIHSRGDFGGLAQEWLKALAASPLRPALAISDKVAVAREIGGVWQNLTLMWTLYRNGKENSTPPPGHLSTGADALAVGTIERGQREVLLDELRQMVREFPPHGFVPHLHGLVELFHVLPDDLIAFFAKLRPRLSRLTAESWISGWLALKRRDIAGQETVRLLVECDASLFDGWLFRGFGDDKLEDLFKQLLFNGSPDADRRACQRTRELLSDPSTFNRLAKIVARVVNAHTSSLNDMNLFFRRFAGQSNALNAVLKCLSRARQDLLIALYAQYDEAQFEDAAYEAYLSAQDTGRVINSFELAMLRHLHRRKGGKLSKRISVRVYGWRQNLFGGKKIDDHIDELLQLNDTPTEDRDAARETKENVDDEKPQDDAPEAVRIIRDEATTNHQAPEDAATASPWWKRLANRLQASLLPSEQHEGQAPPQPSLNRTKLDEQDSGAGQTKQATPVNQLEQPQLQRPPKEEHEA